MKKILFFLLALVVALPVFAVNDTIWLNYKLDRINKSFAEYYGIASAKQNHVFPVLFYKKKTNSFYGKGYIENTTKFIKKGLFVFNEQDTVIMMQGDYNENMKEGEWKEYYTGNKIFRKTKYKKGKRDGMDIMYYENKMVKRISMYVEDSVSWGNCYDSSGREISYFPYEVKPEFIGNIMPYLSENIRYPETAKAENGIGKVIVRFLIDTNGYFRDFKIVQPTRSDLMAEAIRVIAISQPWKPGKRDGKTVEMYFDQPITFRLE